VAVDELLELLPAGAANMGRNVLIRTGVELCGAVIAVEPVYAYVLDRKVAALAAAGGPHL
jgi:hypothetical protein